MKKKVQVEKFKEAAKKLDADETGVEFERAFKKIIPPRSGLNSRPASEKDPKRGHEGNSS